MSNFLEYTIQLNKKIMFTERNNSPRKMVCKAASYDETLVLELWGGWISLSALEVVPPVRVPHLLVKLI